MHMGILDIYFGNEQNCFGKEHNSINYSIFWISGTHFRVLDEWY